MSGAQLPIAALTVIGILLVVLGLFAAGDLSIVMLGLASIGFAGVLGLFAARRA